MLLRVDWILSLLVLNRVSLVIDKLRKLNVPCSSTMSSPSSASSLPLNLNGSRFRRSVFIFKLPRLEIEVRVHE